MTVSGLPTGAVRHVRPAAPRPEGRQPNAPFTLLHEGEQLQARDRGGAQVVWLGNTVRHPPQRGLFIGAERGKQATFHGYLRLGCASKTFHLGLAMSGV